MSDSIIFVFGTVVTGLFVSAGYIFLRLKFESQFAAKAVRVEADPRPPLTVSVY